MLTIITKDLQKFERQANSLQKNFIASTYAWIYDLTEYTKKRMQFYVDSGRTHRSTGKLRSSISTKITVSSRMVRGRAQVGKNIPYQYAVEFGRSKSKYIYPKGNMLSFKQSDWIRKGSNPDIISRYSGVGGYLYFYKVKSGRYAGKHFTLKASQDALKRIDRTAGNVLDRVLRRTFVRIGGLRGGY